MVLHCGPTNSGKTHAALEALKAAGSGVYCGPLRLLAWEVHSRLNAAGTPCTLLTGQEFEEAEGAEHVACTVEMADVTARTEVRSHRATAAAAAAAATAAAIVPKLAERLPRRSGS